MSRTKEYVPDRVVEKAMHLFWTQGYGATSIEDLAGATGLSRSSLYAEYGSKRELFSAVIGRYTDYFGILLTPLSAGGLDAIKVFFRGIESITDDRHLGCLMVNGIAELAPADPDFVRDAGRYRTMIRKALECALRSAEESGEIEKNSAQSRSELLTTQLFGLFIEMRSGEYRAGLDSTVTSIIAEVGSWRRLSFEQRLKRRG